MANFNKILYKYSTKLGTQPIWKFIIIVFGLLLCVVPITGVITELLLKDDSIMDDTSINFSVLAVISQCVIGPIIETLISQLIPIYIINKFITRNLTIQIIIPAILFGVMHYYSLDYIIFASLCGVILGFGFCAYYHHRSLKSAFWSIALVHGLRNLLALISAHLELVK